MRSGKSVSSHEAHLGYGLRRVSNQVSGEFARALQTQQVSVAECVALRLVQQNEKLRPAQLADMLGTTRGGAVSKIVEKLESKRWMGRSASAEDNRPKWFSLTRRGKPLLPEFAALADKNDEYFFGCLDKAERAELRRLLQKLVDFHRSCKVPVAPRRARDC